MKKIKPKLSLVISCFNESKRLPIFFPENYKKLKNFNINFELIFVNDGSTDNTLQVLEEIKKNNPNIKIISYEKNQGKGFGIKTGVLQSSGDIIGYTDADFAISLDQIPKFLEEIEKNNADVVIGKRQKRLSSLPIWQNLLRRILGTLLTTLNTIFLSLGGISDTQCGFKFFKKEVAQKVFPKIQTSGWLFDMEFLSLAKTEKFIILVLPVSWHEIQGSKVKISHDLLPVFLALLKIYYRFSPIKLILILIIFLLIIIAFSATII